MLITDDYIDNSTKTLKTILKQLIENEEQRVLDIATGFFRIEAWVHLEEAMNHLESLRLLIGRDPAIRPAESDRIDLVKYFQEETRRQLEQWEYNLKYKQQIDRAIAFFQQDHIHVRLFGVEGKKSQFLHAKAYIFDNYSIVGSSNLTPAGLEGNTELNVINKNTVIARDLRVNWFEKFWEDPSVDLDYKQKLIEALNASKFGSKPYTPYQVFLKALWELFKDDSMVAEGDRTSLDLASFQHEGFERAIALIERHNGCMVADAVGLGKTYISLRVIDYYLTKLRRPGHVPRSLVLCPAQLRDLVWKKKLDEYGLKADVISHEEMGQKGFDYAKYNRYDLVVVDESHRFRNSATQRYETLRKLLSSGNREKRVLLLTATPINNTMFDLYHQLLLITRGNDNYYQDWGIKNLQKHFGALVKGKAEITELLMQTMVRRSRQDVKKRQDAGEQIFIAGKQIHFPQRQLEKFTYNFEASFQGLYADIGDRVDGLNLAPYNSKEFKRSANQKDQKEVKCNRALVMLQKALYLKRFESSLVAFEKSIKNQASFQQAFFDILAHQGKLLDSKNFRKYILSAQVEDDGETSLVEMLGRLEDIDSGDYDIPQLTEQIETDIHTLKDILNTLEQIRQFPQDQKSDRKLMAFQDLLLTLRGQKILVFSYFEDTAQYIYDALTGDAQWREAMGNPKLEMITGSTSGRRRELIVKHFAPKSNCESDQEQEAIALDPIDILISTDVLSEGQNLQDAGILVNYDLHWNPVRMIQRAGRIDRLGTDYETLYIYNCFPEEGLERLLGLVERLQQRIAEIDNSVGLDASVLGEEISNKSLEELRRLKDADSEEEKAEILAELELASDLVSLDEMRLPLLKFIQEQDLGKIEDIPMGIHSTRYFNIPHRNFSEGGIFLAFKARDRYFWHCYPRQGGAIVTDMSHLVADKGKIFDWIRCEWSDPELLPPAPFDNAIFYVLERATKNLLESLKRDRVGNRFKPRLSGNLHKIKEVLSQPQLWEKWEPEELDIKNQVLRVIGTQRELQRTYKKDIDSIWNRYKHSDEVLAMVTELDELFCENELYDGLNADQEGLQSQIREITEEDLQLICYEWFYPT
ncbi:MAG: helicase-related protein [Arthrospira platensis PCC 7345]|jgi:superfamily II DNA or RNA helicase|uniref:Helicase n=1 Tax=Limnospira platensis NIES-46 TaxID=1236695 RepID=A0A5M3TC72_LIMPL|nr:SNF2-related protein [Arthrospira platensis]MDT9295486.1 helicase-related protein [Arthrospira platensis PCC 7345]GCE95611.1 putative helicase [Arthrospira platensis NIES-46]